MRYDGAEPVRVNKWLAQTGVCSRREAESLIARGLVSINGQAVGGPGRKIAPGETLTIAAAGGRALEGQVTAVLNKPVGFVSAQPEGDQIPAARLLSPANLVGEGRAPGKTASLAPLGRLDLDSRGLLLLSEDGVLARAIIGPQSALTKEYEVQVSGAITPDKVAKLCHGLELDGRKLLRADVKREGADRLRFVLVEGRKRQIRRMCELVGLNVVDLARVRIGPLALGDLAEGQWRHLTGAERAALIAGAQGPKVAARVRSERGRR